MPLSRQTKLYNTFTKGLITEANPLVFPPDTAKELSNVEIARTGKVSRRLGMDIETGGASSADTFTATEIQTKAISTHEWCAVNGDGSLNFAVIQVGDTLYFHDAGADAISASPIGKLDISVFKTDDSFDLSPVDTSCGLGRFFVVGRYLSPFYMEYDDDSNTFTAYKLSLKIRDLEGIDEDGDTSPTVTSASADIDESNIDTAPLLDTTNTIDLSDFTVVFNLDPIDIGSVY